MSCKHCVPDNVACPVCDGDAIELKEYEHLKLANAELEKTNASLEITISNLRDKEAAS